MSLCENLFKQKKSVLAIKMLPKNKRGVYGIRQTDGRPDPWIFIGTSRKCLQTDILKHLTGPDSRDVGKYLGRLGASLEELEASGIRLGWVTCNPCKEDCYIHCVASMQHSKPEYNLNRGRTCADDVPDNYDKQELKTWVKLNYREYDRFMACPYKEDVKTVMERCGIPDYTF